MIDVTQSANRLTIEQVAEMSGRHIKTVRRWCRPFDKFGRPQKYLETARLGGRRYTTREAFLQFVVQGPPQPAAKPQQEIVQQSRNAPAARKEIEQALRTLGLNPASFMSSSPQVH